MQNGVSRRNLLKGLGAAAALSALPAGLVAAPKPRRALRLAHLTDMHVVAGTERPSDAGIAFALDHLNKQRDPAQLVLVGGDNLTGTMAAEMDRAVAMRARWVRAFRDQIKIPALYCIGNHDVWGWNKPRSKATGNEPLYGKNWSKDQLQIDKLYYSVERGGWKIIVLDSIREFQDGYQGGLDDEQFEWLTGEVKTTKPTLVLSHIPVTGISPLMVDGRLGETEVNVPFGSVFNDMFRVCRLFFENKNVKLVLGGHIHVEERVDIHGCCYYNSGAVSGAWWRSVAADEARREATPGGPRVPRSECGYAMIDLHEDGSFEIDQVRVPFKLD